MTTWNPGALPVLPGAYIREGTFGNPTPTGTANDIVGAVIRSNWGPLAQFTTIETENQLLETYGNGTGVDVVKQALLGGAARVRVARAGTGGTVGTLTLQDTTGVPINALRLDLLYPGTRAFAATLRNSLSDATRRELLVYENISGSYTLRETITFLGGAGGGGEPQKLNDAIVAAASKVLTSVKLADGNGVLATVGTVTPQAIAGGADPTTDGAAYSAAMTAIELAEWNVLALDTNDVTIHASAVAFINRLREQEAKRRMLVIGEPTSVAASTRRTNASAFNNRGLVYVGNGFIDTENATREGWQAAARVAGLIASTPVNRSLTNQVVSGAKSVVGGFNRSDTEAALNAGMLTFSTNHLGQVYISQGITTFVTPTADLDRGWSKIRRTRTRDRLMNRIYAAWFPIIGQMNNDADGRSTLIQVAQVEIDAMIAERALIAGQIVTDPARASGADYAYFVADIDDLDGIEKVLLTANFRYAVPTA